MKFIFIDQNNVYYKQAIDIRISIFFSEFDNASILIKDKFENESLQLICLNEKDKVIGTGRLTLANNCGIISQMVIDKKYQKKGIGRRILEILISKCYELNVREITLSARKTAIKFYEKFDFRTYGELYSSKKTGIIHQNMVKNIAE